ncbi:alpha/beta hydrolase [Naumannella huperziae]
MDRMPPTVIDDIDGPRRPGRRLLAAVAVGALAWFAPMTPARAEPLPPAEDAKGITVQRVERVENLERSYDYRISSDKVTDDVQTTYGLSLRVTLPEDYFSSDRDYPVLYIYNGNPGNYREWTEKAGLEDATDGTEVIYVSVEGGETSWYTDWKGSNGSGRKNDWRTFHNEQVVPFIDANLRTIADRDHRGVAGFSMGGFGAIRYAQQYPELYSYAASFSGGLDLEDQVIRGAVIGSLTVQGWNPYGPFGPVVWPKDGGWKEQNPVRHAGDLADTTVSLYAGSGANDADIFERGAGWSTRTFARSLAAAGVEHRFDMYGRNVTYQGRRCNGGHNWDCAGLAFVKERERMLDALTDGSGG